MAEGDGNGTGWDRINNLESDYSTNMLRGLLKQAKQIGDDRKRALAEYVADSQTVEEVAEKLHKIQRGTWFDNLVLAGAAVGGMMAGYKVQGWVDARKGPVPVTGLLGLAGVVPGLAMDRSLTARNVAGLSGVMFLAGAGLYTRAHPEE